MSSSYDAILIVSFGGPEGMADVMPFLQNVTRGRNVPPERLQVVAHHYEMFGGVSPINEQNRRIIDALKATLATQGPALPIYWGNRNWTPFLKDTFEEMKRDGVKTVLAFVTSAYSSYSSCRQYLEDIKRAQDAVGDGAAHVDKLRPFFNHPLFVESNSEHLKLALDRIPEELRSATKVVFTAHSIPNSMASGCEYAKQLQEASRLVAEKTGVKNWELAYQSRSGPPTIPWLEPDILDVLNRLKEENCKSVVVAPIGFISDHMEVIYDLDYEAKNLAQELDIVFERASTASTNPKFIDMIRDLIVERIEGREAACIGNLRALPDDCKPECCPLGAVRPMHTAAPKQE